MTNSKVSIIILNWNKLAYTKNCIASIEENTLYPNYEVILFDNGSTEPGTDEFLSRTKLTVIRSPQNLGFSIGNNRAAAAADGDLLLFLNNDTIVHKNWLEPMVTMLKAYPNCGIVGSRLLYPDSTIQHIRVAFDHKGNCVHPFKRYPADIPEAVRPAECEAVTGACMLMRKEVFVGAGGFDEGYLHGSEDIDLCLKVRKRGLKVMYCPDSIITHYEQVSLKTKGLQYKKKTTRRNRKIFMSRWGATLDEFRLPNDFAGLKPYHGDSHAQAEIVKLVPSSATFILDAGCNRGMLGKALKDAVPGRTVFGVERNRDIAKDAGRYLDKVVAGDIENGDHIFDGAVSFDCIVCDGILEQLRDPWTVLRNLYDHLSPDGTLVCSISNIQYYQVIKDILLDRWRYRAGGALDWEHLRLFSMATIKDLFGRSGYDIVSIRNDKKAGSVLRIINMMLGSRLDKFLTQRYFIVCKRRAHA
jgi:GT2 family glycosyltransferase/protein-L-isoaspartate O-methyltransferase